MTRTVVHMASAHPAFDTRIFRKECQTMVEAGYRVKFIVPHERDEVVEGVEILAVPKPKDGKERMTKTVWQVYRRAMAQEKDAVYHFHDAEQVWTGYLLKAQGRRVVYDVHEEVKTGALYQHWLPRAVRPAYGSVMRGLEKIGGLLFDGFVIAEPHVAQFFPSDRRVVVHNYPMEEELVIPSVLPYHERAPLLTYVGAISPVRGVREVIEALAVLPQELGARLELGGKFFPATLQPELERLPGWAHVHFHGWMSREEMAALFGKVRVGVVTFHRIPRHLFNYPTKLFEYMSAGLPVLTYDAPQIREIVAREQCGLLVDPQDVRAVAEAITWLLTHPEEAQAMGERGRAAIEARYNWAHEARTLLAFYDRLFTRMEGEAGA